MILEVLNGADIRKAFMDQISDCYDNPPVETFNKLGSTFEKVLLLNPDIKFLRFEIGLLYTEEVRNEPGAAGSRFDVRMKIRKYLADGPQSNAIWEIVETWFAEIQSITINEANYIGKGQEREEL